jgi:ubiquinone biosynthesis monooxygenase Coq7
MVDLLPGDLKNKRFIDETIRVNHAGEYGAKRIYEGQMAFMKAPQDQQLLQHMAAQEDEHLAYFTKEMQDRKVRPSVFLPLWHVLGYALGAGTAMLGKTSAMICTEAVEEVIDEHYQSQTKKIEEQELVDRIEQFRLEEIEHKTIAQENMQELHLGHRILYQAIKLGCKLSINIAKKF